MPIDRWVDGGSFSQTYARYADDLFVLGTDRSSLDEFAQQALGKFAAIGLSCRFRIVRFTGFEALGKRFFYDGMAIKRGTAVRAVKKLRHRVDRYNKGFFGCIRPKSTRSSFLGLVQPANDPRWTKRINQVILEKTMRYGEGSKEYAISRENEAEAIKVPEDVRERLAAIARLVGGDWDVKVEIGQPG